LFHGVYEFGVVLSFAHGLYFVFFMPRPSADYCSREAL
jgi:hypothetical protein